MLQRDILKRIMRILKRLRLVSATAFATNSKAGCENEFALFVETEIDTYLPNLSEYINFEKGDKLNTIDISGVAEILNNIGDRIKDVEVYFILSPILLSISATPLISIVLSLSPFSKFMYSDKLGRYVSISVSTNIANSFSQPSLALVA